MDFPLPAHITYRDDERRLTLRLARMGDVEPMLEALHESLTELRGFMPWAHLPQTVDGQSARLAELEAGYQTGGELIFHAYEGEGDGERFVGCFGLHERTLNKRGVEIGYWVRTSAAGRGIATLGTQSLCVLAFDHYDCERVQCAYNDANEGSRRVNDKVGFTQEGRLRLFELQGDAFMRADGYRVAEVTVMNGMLRGDLEALDWTARLRAHLRVEFA